MIASFSSSTMFFIGGCRVFPLPRKSGSSMSYGYQSPRGHGIPLIYHNPSVYGGHVVVFEQVLYSKCLFTTSFPGPSNTNNRKWRQCSSVSSLPCLWTEPCQGLEDGKYRYCSAGKTHDRLPVVEIILPGGITLVDLGASGCWPIEVALLSDTKCHN